MQRLILLLSVLALALFPAATAGSTGASGQLGSIVVLEPGSRATPP